MPPKAPQTLPRPTPAPQRQPPRSATQTPRPPPPAQHPCRRTPPCPPAPTPPPPRCWRGPAPRPRPSPRRSRRPPQVRWRSPHPAPPAAWHPARLPPCACPCPRGWRLMWSGRSKNSTTAPVPSCYGSTMASTTRPARSSKCCFWVAAPRPAPATSPPGACCPSALATARAAKRPRISTTSGAASPSVPTTPRCRWWRARKTA